MGVLFLSSIVLLAGCRGIVEAGDKELVASCDQNTNFEKDAENCGRCQRSCGGAACSQGRCTPLAIGHAGLYVYDMVHRNGRLYWGHSFLPPSTPAAFVSMPVTGGAQTILVEQYDDTTPPLDGASAVATTSKDLYFASLGGTVGRVPLAGGLREDLVTGADFPTAIAIDGDQLFYTTVGSVNVVNVSNLSSTQLSSGTARRFGVAVDSSRVYYTVKSNAPTDDPSDYGVWSMARDGQDLRKEASDRSGHIEVDAASVYWIGDDGTTLGLKAKSGGPTLQLPLPIGDLATFEVDANVVYFAGRGASNLEGIVGRYDLDTNEVTLLAVDSEVHDPNDDLNAIATDAAYVYWTDHKTIWRTPK